MTKHWTPAQIGDQTGRVFLVTGSNSGLGLQTATQLHRHGAQVVMAGRDPAKLARAVRLVAAEGPGPQPVPVTLDLADLASVRACADQVAKLVPTVHVLINNAGVMATPQGQTRDGFETQIGTNHLGHFALTGLILPLMPTEEPAADARVVNVASMAHRLGSVDPDDLDFKRRKYTPWAAYGQSKAANLLFTSELARRARYAGLSLTALAAHPGLSATNLTSAGPLAGRPRPLQVVSSALTRVLGQGAEQGAWPQLYAATALGVHPDDYFGPARMRQTRGYPKAVDRAPAVTDPDLARRLWNESERLTGVSYL